MQMKEDKKKRAWVGLDVSKETFFAAVDTLDDCGMKKELDSLPAREFQLTQAGTDSFLRWLSERFAEYHFSIVMESTGCYSTRLKKFLRKTQGNLSIAIVNGRQSSNFIKSLNLHHKTEKIDAQALARFGTERSPEPIAQDDPTLETLKELGRERIALIRIKNALENRNDSLFDAFTRKVNTHAIEALTLQIKAIEQEIERHIKANAELRHEVELMKTVPGVASTSAYGFLAELGSLKQYSSRELSAMSGLIPRIISSGTSIKKTCLSKRGSGRVRQLLYLDSVTAIEKILSLQLLYQRLTKSGKTKMAARCACMRKLLLIIRAVVVENRPYETNHEKKTKIA